MGKNIPPITLKDFLTKSSNVSKQNLFDTKDSVRKKLPKKIKTKEWFQYDERTLLIIFPFVPCPSGISGAVKIVFHPLHFAQYKQLWKWQYIHERGDAIKLNTESGLTFLKGDPLLLPISMRRVIYSLIFQTTVEDFIL